MKGYGGSVQESNLPERMSLTMGLKPTRHTGDETLPNRRKPWLAVLRRKGKADVFFSPAP